MNTPLKMRDINTYVLKNPDALTAIYTQIFGKYLMRYYDTTGEYAVFFEDYAETSFMSSKDKRIVISGNNVREMLKANVHILAVAYHELCHILYTSDRARDLIRKKAIIELLDSGVIANPYLVRQNGVEQQIHGIWNVLEDARIERLLVQEHPFLKDIIEPLKSVLGDDDKLFTWRRGAYSNRTANVNPEIIALAEAYAGQKHFKAPTIQKSVEIITRLYEIIFGNQVSKGQQQPADYSKQKYQPTQDDTEAQSPGTPTPTDQHGEDDDAESEGDDLDDDGADGDADGDDADDAESEGDDDSDDDGEGSAISRKELEQRERDLAKAQAQDEQEKGILRMLKDIQQTQRANQDAVDYNASVIEDHVSPNGVGFGKKDEIPAIFSIAQDVRNGMTAAQRKSYTSNVSNRVSVPRLVEALTSKQEPKIFSNKGKDFTQLRKVVIFEDVSGSTSGQISYVFSQIAYALARSFNMSEWWLYGSQLAKKHLKDYKYLSEKIGLNYYNVGGCTNSDYLLNVMKKYQDEKAIFVVITDGDINSLIYSELFSKFKDSTAIVGFIHEKHTSDIKHAVNFHKEFVEIREKQEEKLKSFRDSIVSSGLVQECSSEYFEMIDIEKRKVMSDTRAFMPIINRSLQQVVEIVKGKIK